MPAISLTSDEQDMLRKAAYGAVNLVAIAYPGPVAIGLVPARADMVAKITAALDADA